MSVRLAAGCALSRSHGVSVVPMIQCRPHGITKRTDVSVRTMNPASERIRSRGTTRWMPLRRLHVQRAAPADHLLDLVGPHAGGVDDHAGPDLELASVLQVEGADADHPLALAQEAGDLDPGRDVGAVGGRGAGDREHEPGVVDLAVVVADRAGDRLGREVRRDPGHAPCGTGAGAGADPPRPGRTGPWRRRAAARRRRTAAPSRGGSAGRGTAPAGPGAAPAG